MLSELSIIDFAIIDRLRLFQGKGQPIRTDGPQSHLVTKKGTPTMGGLLILTAALTPTLLPGELFHCTGSSQTRNPCSRAIASMRRFGQPPALSPNRVATKPG